MNSADRDRIEAAQSKRRRKLEKILNTPAAKARRIIQEREAVENGRPYIVPKIPDDSPEIETHERPNEDHQFHADSDVRGFAEQVHQTTGPRSDCA